MKYVKSIRLFETLEDDNILFEISNVINQRLLEEFLVRYVNHPKYDSMNPSTLIDYLINGMVIEIPYKTIRNTLIDPKTIKKNKRVINDMLEINYNPTYNELSNTQLNILKKILSYNSLKHKKSNGFKIEVKMKYGSTRGKSYTSKDLIELFVSTIEGVNFINNIRNKNTNLLNDGVFIIPKLKSTLFHELRHLYDDYLSGGKDVKDNLKNVSQGFTRATYISQPHEISAWTSQFIQDLERGLDDFSNRRTITFKSPWKKVLVAVKERFDYFEGFDRKVIKQILSKIFKHWVKVNQ